MNLNLPPRGEIIDEIIKDLEERRTLCKNDLLLAIDENLEFFKSAKSFIKFFGWLVVRASKISRDKLLELSDFGIEKWEKILLNSLINLEKKKFPGVVAPLRDALVGFIIENEPKMILEIGCGGMEVVRQVLSKLKDAGYSKRIIFIGVDLSSCFYEVVDNNLQDLKEFVEVRKVDFNKKDWQKNATEGDKNLVLLFKGDALKMNKFFGDKSIDLVFYSKFAHHLTAKQRLELHFLTEKISKFVIEYDDYRSWPLLLPQVIFAWNNPVLMNGAVISRLRDYSKKELVGSLKLNWKIKFFSVGSYIKTNVIE